MEVLQTSALPLGYGAATRSVWLDPRSDRILQPSQREGTSNLTTRRSGSKPTLSTGSPGIETFGRGDGGVRDPRRTERVTGGGVRDRRRRSFARQPQCAPPYPLRARGFSDTCQGSHSPRRSTLAVDALLLAPSPQGGSQYMAYSGVSEKPLPVSLAPSSQGGTKARRNTVEI
jgi:hypothetical protein